MKQVPVAIAYVTDNSVLADQHLTFAKCHYAAIGTASDISNDKPLERLTKIKIGCIDTAFGLGKAPPR